MKICLINNLYPPYAVGGTERFVEEQAVELANQGQQVMIITARPWQGWSYIRPVAGKDGKVTIYRLWQPNIFWYKDLAKHGLVTKLIWHFFDIFNWWLNKEVKDILKKERPDEVWTHNLTGVGFGIPQVIQKLGIKHVHYLHDVQLIEPSGVIAWPGEKLKFSQKFYGFLMKKKFGRPEVVIALSKFLEEFYWFKKFFPGSRWETKNDKTVLSLPKELPEVTDFLFVGSLVKHKGVELLLQAWESISGRANLYIVGDGELLPLVELWSQKFNNVNIYGRLERDGLARVYEKCQVLLFTSTCLENRPKVILEALQNGFYIIAADTGGVRELLTGNENAWLFKPGDVEELVKRMKRFT